MRYFIPLALMLMLGGLFWAGLDSDPTVVPSALIGKPAPEFALPSLEDAERVFTHADLRGRTTMVHVWATWCPNCRAERPVLHALARRGLVPIVGLNYRDERRAARAWLANYGNPYEYNLYDAQGKVGIDFGVYGTPETFIIDRAGIIRYKHVGPLTETIIERELVPLLQELEAGR